MKTAELNLVQTWDKTFAKSDNVDDDRIGIIGVCGWGGMALNTAAIDTRIKATVAATMYDMARVNANGYFDSEDSEEARYEKSIRRGNIRVQADAYHFQ